MKEYVIDCSKIDSEQEFWNAYLNVVKPEGTEYFGRNLDAFWDALSAGGPGWPGNDNGCKIRFINTETIKMLRNGKFYSVLKEIEKISFRKVTVMSESKFTRLCSNTYEAPGSSIRSSLS